MEKMLDCLQSIMLAESRCFARLIKLCRWEQSNIEWGKQSNELAVLSSKRMFIERIKQLEAERRQLRALLQPIFDHPKTDKEYAKTFGLVSLYKRMRQKAEALVRLSQENILLVHHSSLRQIKEDVGHQHKEVNILCETLSTPVTYEANND